jgi:hypothetical protein
VSENLWIGLGGAFAFAVLAAAGTFLIDRLDRPRDKKKR